jgi:hypothetical protein
MDISMPTKYRVILPENMKGECHPYMIMVHDGKQFNTIPKMYFSSPEGAVNYLRREFLGRDYTIVDEGELQE